MSSRTALAERTVPPHEDVPPLHAGDRLTREEFERRWDLHPEIKKAELIDGMVFLEMTVSRKHGKPHTLVAGWALTYCGIHPELEALDSVTVRFADGNNVQPDVLVRRIDGGSSSVSEDDCVDGPPELIIEIAASSASYDLHIKKPLYERNGVAEYLIWTQYEQQVDWWSLENGHYEPLAADAEGVIESRVFPGLRLPVRALLEGDIAALLAAARG